MITIFQQDRDSSTGTDSRERHEQDSQEGGDGLPDVLPGDMPGMLHHESPDLKAELKRKTATV